MMKLLEGKTALITGGARGIGKAIAITFAQHGADVAVSDLKVDDQTSLLERELQAFGVKAKAYASDASSFEGSEELINNVINDFGKIDILVNNAGITRDNLLMRMNESDWDLVIKVNLKSIFNMTKAVQKQMLKQRFGSIINMSSVVGLSGNAGQSNYSASKAGLVGFTKSIAQEIGSRNIRCNAIAPGYIETEMTAKLSEDVRKAWAEKIPLRRGGKPQDVADAALFLASDLSSYITGQVISVCGGMHT
jgi:3-oxoacyl-[acyl-carrier protein] reductase